MPTVGAADGAANPEAALGEVQSVSHLSPDAVVVTPDDAGIDAALENQILDEPADWVVGERSDNSSAEPETAPEAARDVVLSSTLPGAKASSGVDPRVARIQTKHHLAERDEVVAACFTRSERDHATTSTA